MFIKPLSKEALERYLDIPDLTMGDEPHAVKLLYQKIEAYIRNTHLKSEIIVHRESPIVTLEDNYDNLLIDRDNISRSSTYTHYVDETHILRTHDTAHIPGILRSLAKRDDWSDVIILLPALAYRRDVSDKKHLSAIHMLGIWRICKQKMVTKDDLLTVVKGIADQAAPGWQLRIIETTHPYTKGGLEVNVTKDDKDIEILECGLISDKLLERSGLDPHVYQGWASGMGLDRLVMTLKDIPDVRYLRSANPAIAKQMINLDKYNEVSNQPAIKRDMSYCVPKEYVEEDISEDIREALGDEMHILESVEVLNETEYKDLPQVARKRLGCDAGQKNVLVRITLRHLEKSLTNNEANYIYSTIYVRINYGSAGYI